jgi:hypothetical protein
MPAEAFIAAKPKGATKKAAPPPDAVNDAVNDAVRALGGKKTAEEVVNHAAHNVQPIGAPKKSPRQKRMSDLDLVEAITKALQNVPRKRRSRIMAVVVRSFE